VTKRQRAYREKLEEFRERIKPTHERICRKLQELFPELQSLSMFRLDDGAAPGAVDAEPSAPTDGLSMSS
jgi:hypothetical protein